MVASAVASHLQVDYLRPDARGRRHRRSHHRRQQPGPLSRSRPLARRRHLHSSLQPSVHGQHVREDRHRRRSAAKDRRPESGCAARAPRRQTMREAFFLTFIFPRPPGPLSQCVLNQAPRATRIRGQNRNRPTCPPALSKPSARGFSQRRRSRSERQGKGRVLATEVSVTLRCP